MNEVSSSRQKFFEDKFLVASRILVKPQGTRYGGGEIDRFQVDAEVAVGGGIGQQRLDKETHLVAGSEDVFRHQTQFGIAVGVVLVQQKPGAHAHAGEVVLEVMRNHAQKFFLFPGQLLEVVARRLEHEMGANADSNSALSKGRAR